MQKQSEGHHEVPAAGEGRGRHTPQQNPYPVEGLTATYWNLRAGDRDELHPTKESATVRQYQLQKSC